MDCLFVNPNNSGLYQELAIDISAIEPPTWALLLAESCRSVGHEVSILDAEAERLPPDQVSRRIDRENPRIVLFVVYGQNPNSGTTGMAAVGECLKELSSKEDRPFLVGVVGSHASAAPKDVLRLENVDFVLLNEGVYALRNLLRHKNLSDLTQIKGIGHKIIGPTGTNLILNEPEIVVPQDRMDVDLPGYAWDLLPYKKSPLDMYRAHFWHAGFDYEKRTPFAAIYTSLGCQFACNFCMINIVNRTDNRDHIDASHSSHMRFWSPDWVRRQMQILADLGVKALRISDEMFFLNKKFYNPILSNAIDADYGFNMWTYSRVDTVRPDYLELFKRAGVNWLALGIEAGNQNVRQEVSKGSFKDVNIRDVCDTVRNADINVISNYIFGFPDDDLNTMTETLELALELNTEMANFYPCQALPGSPMYQYAKRAGWDLPKTYAEYGFLSYESKPLPTKHLSASEVLKFRDDAWQKYFTNPDYLSLVESRFGLEERQNVEGMTKITLRRRLLEET